MLRSTQQFIDKLIEKEIHYIQEDSTESGKDVIRVNFNADNLPSVSILFFFGTDNEDVSLRVFDLVKFTPAQEANVLKAVCSLNMTYRFAKFCIDSRDNTVQAEMDAVFREHDVGEICYELMGRMLNICDEAYPEIMKALWS